MLAAWSPPLARRAEAGQLLEVRIDDIVYLKNNPQPLVGRLIYRNDNELKIELQGSRIARIVKMADVERVLPAQNLEQAFDRRLEEMLPLRDAARLHELARAAIGMEPVKMADRAVRALEQGRTVNPGYIPGRLLLGRLYLDLGENEKARAEGQAVSEAEPEKSAGHVLLGLAWVRQGDYQAAAESVEKALAFAPSVEDRIAAAGVLAEGGRLGRAGAVIDAVLKEETRNVEAKLTAGLIMMRRGDLTGAAPLLTEAAQKLRDRSAPRLALAALHYLQGDLTAARSEINAALSYGGRAHCHALKALIELRDGKHDAAAKSADFALRMDARSPRVCTAVASVRMSSGATESALEALDGATAAGRSVGDAYLFYLQGHLFSAAGQNARALAAFVKAGERTAGEKGPGWIDAHLAAGAIALRDRKFPEAAKAFRSALAIDDQSARAHAGLGLASLGVPGQDEMADRELRRALALDARNVHAYLGLGCLANRQKREAEAINYFERAAGLAGDNVFAVEALAKLRAGRGEEVEFFAFDGQGLPPGWSQDQRSGPIVETRAGRLTISGRQTGAGGRDTRVNMALDARRLSRFDMDVEAAPAGELAAGIYVAESRGFVELGMLEAGKLCWRMKNRGGYSAPEVLMDWPGRARLGIEAADVAQGRFRLYVNGRLRQEVTVDTLAGSPRYEIGGFCRAQTGEEVRVDFDNASLITRKGAADVAPKGE
jgi:tetratricopeptide (TPR) repeat protein